MASTTERAILSPSFHSFRKEHLAQWPAFCVLNTTKNRGGGGYFQKNWVGCAATFLKPFPSFRPNSVIFPPLFQTWSPGARRVTSYYGTYTLVGVNIKREMVLSPNDEEVANSSKKHTQFKTKVHKPYPGSDQNGRNWYPISDQNG